MTPLREAIAIIGIGCRFPGADGPEAFWKLLRDGVDAIREVPADRWDVEQYYDPRPGTPGKTMSRWGGFLDQVDLFDAEFFGISRREARTMDPQQRLVLEVAWEALEHAGRAPHGLAGSRTGVFVGIYHDDYATLRSDDPREIDTYCGTGTARALAANRLSYFLDLRGPSLTVDTTCSSSLVAVHQANQCLWLHECDLALAGGVSLMLSASTAIAASQLLGMAADGRCKTFDARADGIVRGEGCGIVVLKRLADARRDGDRVLAVVHGSAVNQDGLSNGLTAPSQDAQEGVVRDALRMGGISPADVSFIETHGTGTHLGDPIEVAALASVFGDGGTSRRIPLGAVKSNIGHLEAAAGIAALIKVVLCLTHREIPANLHFSTPNAELRLSETPFTIPTCRLPWLADGPRIAGVSAFSIGGTNAHVVLGEPPDTASAEASEEPDGSWPAVLPLSGADDAALRALARSYAGAMPRLVAERVDLRDMCRSAALGRSHLRHRAAIVTTSRDHLEHSLTSLAGACDEPNLLTGVARGALDSPVFVFSGQGCHWVGMGRGLLHGPAACRLALDECDATLRQLTGRSVIDELNSIDAARMARTVHAQPLIFSIQMAVAAQLREWGVEPAAVVGHSLGEIAAACTAGALSTADGMRIVVARIDTMAALEGRGGMVAIDLDEREVQPYLNRVDGDLCVAAVNGPRSIVVAGSGAPLARLSAMLVEDDVPCRQLPVDCAFHSPQVAVLGGRIAAACAGLHPTPPSVPIVSTVTGHFCDGGAFDARYWSRNATEAVRFAAAVARLVDWGASAFLEIGPHAVLRRDLRSCLESLGADLPVIATGHRGRPDLETLLSGIGALYVNGYPLNWERIYSRRGPHVSLPTYPWQRTRHWWSDSSPKPSAQSPSVADYELEWIEESPPEAGSSGEAMGVETLARRTEAQCAAALEQFDRHSSRFVPRIESLCRMYAVLAVRRLAELTGKHRASQLHSRRRLVAHLRRLADAHDGSDVSFELAAETADSLLIDFPECAEELLLLRTCGPALVDVIAGEADPLQLLFGGDMATAVDRLYRASPFAKAFNPALAAVLSDHVRQRPDASLRILEIGAGTGGSTSAILPLLPAARTTYQFTDVSPRFLDRARREFAQFPFVCYSLLDIESDPALQGVPTGAWDVVVASNVVHATRDIGRCVDHARALLKPDGLLLMLEGTSSLDWAALTFGTTPGWWKSEDGRSDGPLLTGSEWLELLASRGFHARVIGANVQRPGRGVILVAGVTPRPSRDTSVPWLVIGGGELGQAVAAELARAGAPSAWWEDARAVAPSRVQAWRATAGPVARIVHAGSLDTEWHDLVTAADLDAIAAQTVASVAAIVQGVVADRDTRVWVLTRCTPGIAGAGGPHLGQALAWGATRVLAAEHPEVWGGIIDIESGAASVPAVVATLCAGPRGEETAVRDGRRRVARLRRRTVPTRTGAPLVRRDGSYLIAGGLGGVGLALAEWIVAHEAGRVVLASRRGGTPEAEAMVARLRGRGTEVWTRALDVTCAASVAALVEACGAGGFPLRGVIHAAGVVEDGVVAQLDSTRLLRVLAPKVLGGWHLHAATRAQPLDWFVLCSSAAALLGLPGLASYAAANAFLDALAHFRRAQGLPSVAIDWSGWADTGMAAAVGAVREAQWRMRGLLPMSVADGLSACARVLESKGGPPQWMIGSIDWRTFIAGYPRGHEPRLFDHLIRPAESSPVDPGPTGSAGLTDQLLPRDEVAIDRDRPALVSKFIDRQIRRSLMMRPDEPLSVDTPFTELGIDSLMAVELRNVLSRAIGVTLPSTVLFECPTVDALSAYVSHMLSTAGSVESAGGLRA